MLRIALAELRFHTGRFTAVCLAILLGVGFAAGTLIFTASADTSLARSVGADVSRTDVVVTTENGALDLARIARVPGVQQVEPVVRSYADFTSPSGRGSLQLQNIPVDPAHRWYSVASGHWPSGPSELAVDTGTATRNSLEVGSHLTLGSAPARRQVTVVALLDTRVSPLANVSDSGYGTLALLQTMPDPVVRTAHVNISTTASADQVATAIVAALPGPVTAQPAAEVAAAQVRQLAGNSDVLTAILSAFVALAALVAAMVVANTFTIVLTQRQRQIALLRCIGATASQLRRSILVEAMVMGVVGSAFGLAAGVVGARIVTAAIGMDGSTFTVGAASLAVTGLTGVVVTMVAALGPTARAARIPPVAALRPVESAQRSRAIGRVRLALGTLLCVGGAAVLAGGVVQHVFPMAVGGGAITAVGVLVMLRVVLPVVLRLLSGLGGVFGAPGRLAVANTLRNPARAATTCTALVVGVGAIATVLVASASAKAGADAAVDARNPLDLQVTAVTGTMPSQLLFSLPRTAGVQAAVAVSGTVVSVGGNDVRLFGPTAAEWGRVRNGGELSPGEVALPVDLTDQLDLSPGDPVTLHRGAAAVTLRLAVDPLTDDGSAVTLQPALLALDPHPAIGAVWAKFTSDAAPNEVIGRVNPAVAPFADVNVSGAGVQRAATSDVLDSLITLALALLAVTAVIAVVGIGNSLGLSVVERTRESALLRALGLRRRQLRAMLAVEAGLLALVAATVGIVFGLIFGWAAVGAAFGQADEPVILTVPYGRLSAVFAGTLLAGVIASVLPGRRAASTTPTQALVEV